MENSLSACILITRHKNIIICLLLGTERLKIKQSGVQILLQVFLQHQGLEQRNSENTERSPVLRSAYTESVGCRLGHLLKYDLVHIVISITSLYADT